MTRIQHPAPAPWLLAAALPTVIAVGSYAFWAVPTPPNLRPDSFSYLFYLTAGAFDEGRNAGYATFLILVHKLVGLDRLPTLQFLAQAAAQIVAAGVLAAAYGRAWVGMVLILLLLFQGQMIENATMVLTEGLFTAGLTLCAAGLAATAKRPAGPLVLTAAVGLALATAAKSIGVVLVVPALLLARFLPTGLRGRTVARIAVPAVVVYLAMALHGYGRNGHLAPEHLAGFALAGHVGWILDGEIPGRAGLIPEMKAAAEPVLARRPAGLTDVKSAADLEAYVRYTAAEYNHLLNAIAPTAQALEPGIVATNRTLLYVAFASITAHAASYAGHVAAHFYGLWRLLGEFPSIPTAALDWRAGEAALAVDKIASYRRILRGLVTVPSQDDAEAMLQAQLALPLSSTYPTRFDLAPATLAIGVLALALGFLFLAPLRLARPYRAEIMLALTINTYFFAHAMLQVALPRYAGVAFPAAAALVLGFSASIARTLVGVFRGKAAVTLKTGA